MPLRSKSLCGFAFSANSQRNSGERPFFGYPCPPVVKCVDSTVFWTGENVPSERVRSKPADIGQLLLQCRRRCSRVIVSLIPPNHTLSRGGGNHLCTVSSAARRNVPRGKIHPRPRQGLIAAVLASAIIRKDRYAKKRKRQLTTTICSNIYTTIRASEQTSSRSLC